MKKIFTLTAVSFMAFIAVTAAAAGGSKEEAAPEETAAGSQTGFPVTIEHKYGSVTIQEEPQRIVSVGFTEQDILLALGITPAAVRETSATSRQPMAVWPWGQKTLDNAEFEVLAAGELDIEAVAAVNPDLIIGLFSGISQEEYDLLSQIAPVLAQPGEYPEYGTPWQEMTRLVGRAAGRQAKAEELVNAVENQIRRIRESHPEFHGKKIAVAFIYQNQPGVYASWDVRGALLEKLGFEVPEIYDELAGDSFYASFSEERADLLNEADVLIWYSDDARELPLRESLTASAEGRELFIGETPKMAFFFSSVLSLPYLLDLLEEGLAAVLDDDPATLPPPELR